MPPAAAHRHPGILRQLLLPLEDPDFRPLGAAERRRLGELAVQWRDADTARRLQED